MDQINYINPEAVRNAIGRLELFLDDTGLPYLLIKRISGRPARTESGIVLPEEQGKNMGDKAIVIKIAEGSPTQINMGDKIIYHRWAATEIELEGEKFSVLSSRDVIGIYARKNADSAE